MKPFTPSSWRLQKMIETAETKFDVAMTLKVKAMSLVAAHLGTDLTMLRANGKRLRYVKLHGADHVIEDWNGRQFLVDLVIETVSPVVGVPIR